MPVVKMPDGTLVDMPDNPTPEQRAALQAILSKASQAAVPAPKEEVSGLGETARVIGKSLYGGLTSLPRFVMQAGDWLEEKIPTPDWTKIPIPGYDKIAEVDKAVREAVEPKTKSGKVVGNIGEAAVGAIASPGGLAAPIKSAIIGASSGAGSEAAAAAFGDNAVTRVLGGVAGGLTGGLVTAAKTNRSTLAREALADVRPEDLAVAVERMKAARDAGIPINLSQAMPRASNIDAYVEALANSKHGRNVTEQLRKQPQQIAFGVEEQMANLPGQIRMPQVLANNAQEAATAAIDAAKRARTNAWQKAYDDGLLQSRQLTVPETAVAAAYQKLTDLANSVPNTSKSKLLMDLRDRLVTPEGFITEPLQLNEILKDAAGRLKPVNLATSGLDAGTAKWVGKQISALRDDFGNAFEPIQKANAAYQAATPAVDALKKSVVGRIAGRTGAQDAIEAPQARLFSVFEKGTVPGATSSEILTLEKAFRQAGQPEVFQDAAKSWIAGKVSTALKSTDNRMPENIGERLRVAFGDPRQLDQTSKGFEDILAGLARSQGVPEAPYVKGFKHFMEIVSDAARRPGSVRGVTPGEVKEMASEGVFRRLGQVSVMTPIRQPALKWASFLEADALSTMDKLLTTPEGVATLVKLGKQPPYSHAAVTTMATFLGTNAAAQGGNRIPPALRRNNTTEKLSCHLTETEPTRRLRRSSLRSRTLSSTRMTSTRSSLILLRHCPRRSFGMGRQHSLRISRLAGTN